MKTTKPKILFYDIETSPLLAWIWRPGKQHVGHHQLKAGNDQYGIICITYCWNDGKPAKVIDWGYTEQDTIGVVKKFQKITKDADIIIGKNSDRFDNKHLNTIKMLGNLPADIDWLDRTEDLESHVRRNFYLPSYSLDYISKLLGLGGKVKMELEDWVDIVTKHPTRGLKKLKKMCYYGKKDSTDLRAAWNKMSNHFKWKHRTGSHLGLVCSNIDCQSNNLKKNGTRIAKNGLTYQQFHCHDHNGYAGKALINKKTGKLGKIVP